MINVTPVPEWQRILCGIFGVIGWVICIIWLGALVRERQLPAFASGLVLIFLLPLGSLIFTCIALKGRLPFFDGKKK